jgi:hypothetical protein
VPEPPLPEPAFIFAMQLHALDGHRGSRLLPRQQEVATASGGQDGRGWLGGAAARCREGWRPGTTGVCNTPLLVGSRRRPRTRDHDETTHIFEDIVQLGAFLFLHRSNALSK